MERTALLWKAVHMVSAVRKWSEEVDYEGLAMRHQAEGFVFLCWFWEFDFSTHPFGSLQACRMALKWSWFAKTISAQ